MSNYRYVVWNGHTQSDYEWDGIHDCIALYDGLMSIQELCKYFFKAGFEPVIIFACQSGKSAMEIKISDKSFGLASYCFRNALNENHSITIRDMITRMNSLIAEMGFDQIGEVICREDLLDHPFLEKHPHYKLSINIFDCCRTPIR